MLKVLRGCAEGGGGCVEGGRGCAEGGWRMYFEIALKVMEVVAEVVPKVRGSCGGGAEGGEGCAERGWRLC